MYRMRSPLYLYYIIPSTFCTYSVWLPLALLKIRGVKQFSDGLTTWKLRHWYDVWVLFLQFFGEIPMQNGIWVAGIAAASGYFAGLRFSQSKPDSYQDGQTSGKANRLLETAESPGFCPPLGRIRQKRTRCTLLPGRIYSGWYENWWSSWSWGRFTHVDANLETWYNKNG